MSRKFYIITIATTIFISIFIIWFFIYFQEKNKNLDPVEIPKKTEKNSNLLPIDDLIKKEKIEIKTEEGVFSIDNIYKQSKKMLSNNGVAFEDNDDYYIAFYPDDNSFIIAVLSSDFNKGREKVESVFLRDLGITKDQACKLEIVLSVPNYINEDLSGKNYGLSFCNSQ